jgi:hypothetical protein
MRSASVSSVALALVLVVSGCGDDGPPGEQRRALPDGAACTEPSEGQQEPREFDATALVAGPTTQPGNSIELTICLVPSTTGRAVASVALEDGRGDIEPTVPTVQFPVVTAGERQVGTVEITVPEGVRGNLRTTIALTDEDGQPAGRYIDSTYVLGGPDAVFVSETSLGSLDQVALEHEREGGRISDEEYERRREELREPPQLSPAP